MGDGGGGWGGGGGVGIGGSPGFPSGSTTVTCSKEASSYNTSRDINGLPKSYIIDQNCSINNLM